MQTTIDLPEPLLQAVQQKARETGVPLDKLIASALANELEHRHEGSRRRIAVPVRDSKEPGVLHLTNAQLEQFLG
jgi:hypothetical protein